ncbi:MAG: sensor domain-containing diguanylate cyclase [Acidobacteriota bacterium]|jgi:diguanylate cyclase (GGDEF)-like protein|nr:sensor domain-containing diguanylate cyclase [Acidobacteriota bacterium]
MKNDFIQTKIKTEAIFNKGYLLSIIISLSALFFTFIAASAANSFEIKLYIFSLIIAVYLIIEVGIFHFYKQTYSQKENTSETESGIFTADIEEKLLVLEEANKFFGASLKSADMFRLVTSRIGQLVEFDTCALFIVNEQSKLESKYAVGLNSRLFDQIEIDFNEGLAGKAFFNIETRTVENLQTEREQLPKAFLENLNSAISIPLLHGVEVFGVINLYSRSENYFDNNKKILLEAIGERVAPLINSSLAFEKSISNALTDNLTNLPNERAFYLVLENQIAEAQRTPENRDLTILAIDIKNFAELNSKYGHITGDKILAFTSELLKKQLRQMDFLARSQNDEFLIVLPTASGEVTKEIINRIEKLFETKSYTFDENTSSRIKLNFGSATFYKDGETANQLLNTAIIRKRDNKIINSGSVLRFPGEYIN